MLLDRYSNNMNCSVTYQMGQTCSAINFDCNIFDIHNNEPGFCREGDKMILEDSTGETRMYV